MATILLSLLLYDLTIVLVFVISRTKGREFMCKNKFFLLQSCIVALWTCGTIQKLNMILLYRTAALFCYIVGEFRGYVMYIDCAQLYRVV